MLDITARSSEAQVTDFIVCGWYTPDYGHWWDKLRDSLDAIGAPHDFVAKPKLESWERTTMQKPSVILSAMDRHPQKTLIILDVDCVIRGTLDDLRELASIPGDIGLPLCTKWKSRSRKVKHWFRTGTMVVRPTKSARQFIQTWIEESAKAPFWAVDQDSLVVALSKSRSNVTILDIRFCARADQNIHDPVIVDQAASTSQKRISSLRRLVEHYFNRKRDSVPAGQIDY